MAIIDTLFQIIGGVCVAAVVIALFMPALLIWSLLAIAGWAVLYIFWENYYRSKMAWTREYWGTWEEGHSLMIFLQKAGRILLRSDSKYMAGSEVIDNERAKEFYAFIKSDKAVFKAGRSIAQLVYDGCNVILNPEYLLGVSMLRRKGYHHIDDLQKAIEEGKFTNFTDEEIGVQMTLIRKSDKDAVGDDPAGKEVKLDPKKIYIPVLRAIDVHDIRDWVSGDPTIEKALIDTAVLAERRANEKTGFGDPNIQKMVLIIVATCIGLAILKTTNVI